MALTEYTYDISDFLNNAVNIDRLRQEIITSDISHALDHINSGSTQCSIWFKDAISAGDETTLDTIVGAHNGTSLPNATPKMADGRPIVRADSRPLGTETYFSCAGDDTSSPGDLGGGNTFFWDFSNSDNDMDSGVPIDMKGKEIDLTFNDPVWIKEGTLYIFDAIKGSYCDFSIWAPEGYPYYDRDNNPQVAGAGGVMLYRYVHHHFFATSIPMGDELNTEGCQQEGVPAGYIIRGNIYVPDTDSVSYGWCSIEMYRTRTVLFPGESI